MTKKQKQQNRDFVLLKSGKISSKKFFINKIKLLRETTEEDLRGRDFPDFFQTCKAEFHQLGLKINDLPIVAKEIAKLIYMPSQQIFSRDGMDRIQEIGQDITTIINFLKTTVLNKYIKLVNEGMAEASEVNTIFIEIKNKEAMESLKEKNK